MSHRGVRAVAWRRKGLSWEGFEGCLGYCQVGKNIRKGILAEGTACMESLRPETASDGVSGAYEPHKGLGLDPTDVGAVAP